MSLFDVAVEAIGIPESQRPQVRRMLLCYEACAGVSDETLERGGHGYVARLLEGNNVDGTRPAAVEGVSTSGRTSAGAE